MLPGAHAGRSAAWCIWTVCDGAHVVCSPGTLAASAPQAAGSLKSLSLSSGQQQLSACGTSLHTDVLRQWVENMWSPT